MNSDMDGTLGLRAKSAASLWRPLASFVHADARLGVWAQSGGRLRIVLYEFIRFGVKQAWACLFGGLMVGLIMATRLYYPAHAPLARYDFLFLMALAIQILFLVFRLESCEEARVIFVFHVVGTIMEVYKTAYGSWTYPEHAFFRIGGVPLFTGFMYASIGSYMMRAWALFDFRFTCHPPMWRVCLLALAIYVNFFTHHFIPDFRWVLVLVTVSIFWPTTIWYRIHHSWRRMPLLLAAFLSATFIWLAENIGTYSKIWLYPGQLVHWTPVGFGKFSSWFLLQIVSYALVAVFCHPSPPDDTPLARSRDRHRDRLTFRNSVAKDTAAL